MNGDKFISSNKHIFNPLNYAEEENNFFMQNEGVSFPKFAKTEPIRHINDYDSNILQEDAYKDVNDEIFKLEYKIAKIESELGELNKQIKIAEEIHDYYESEQLTKRKTQLERELILLTDLYNEASISAKISGGVTSKIKNKIDIAGKNIEKLGLYLLSKLPGKLASIFEIKHSLTILENINKNVDELMKSRYPYGEAAEKYEQLSKYIAKANSIQSEIYGFMK